MSHSVQLLESQDVPRSQVQVIKQRVIGKEVCPSEADYLAIEDPFEIVIEFKSSDVYKTHPLTLTMRTPGNDRALIVGFLFSEGIIRKLTDIDAIRFSEPCRDAAPTQAVVRLSADVSFRPDSFGRNFVASSSCGVCGKTSSQHLALPPSLILQKGDIRVDAALLHALPGTMRREQTVFEQTGGLHAAALFSPTGDLLASCEDIGRHNALDKVIGEAISSEVFERVSDPILCVSGRMSYEIIQKALMARIPLVTGVGAPSSLAVALANDFNLTLIGFLKNETYNIYSCPERLTTHLRK